MDDPVRAKGDLGDVSGEDGGDGRSEIVDDSETVFCRRLKLLFLSILYFFFFLTTCTFFLWKSSKPSAPFMHLLTNIANDLRWPCQYGNSNLRKMIIMITMMIMLMMYVSSL